MLGLHSKEGPGVCVHVASLRPPFPKPGHLPWHRHSSLHTPGGPAAYSKSPSRYLSKAWRTTVLTAMSGFTTQNCRVACGGKRPRVRMSTATTYQAPPLAGWACAGCRDWRRGPVSSPEGTAVWRRRQNVPDDSAVQLCEKTRMWRKEGHLMEERRSRQQEMPVEKEQKERARDKGARAAHTKAQRQSGQVQGYMLVRGGSG